MTIYVNGDEFGTTPKEMNITLVKDHIITIVLDGYKQETIETKIKNKEAKNMTQSKINSASMVNANPLSIAEFVMQSSGTVNPNNFTFKKIPSPSH